MLLGRCYSLEVDCSRRPGISPGARRLVCQGVEGKCSDVVEGKRYGGPFLVSQDPLTPSNTRGVLCSSCPRKMHAAAVPWLPMPAGMSQTGAVLGGGTEFAIMTRSLFSSWAQLRKLSSAVIYVDIRKAFCSVLVGEVVGPVMERSDRVKAMVRLGWTESELHLLEATLQGRQHETALLGMTPDVAAMLADWHQTNWFTVQRYVRFFFRAVSQKAG